MGIVGVKCGFDGTNQKFQTCIDAHESRGKNAEGRTCHCPTAMLKDARDNTKRRKGAGISVSTLLQCPRAYAIEKTYDLYEPLPSMYNKFRGTSVHSIFENEPDIPDWIIRERRAYVEIDGTRVTGQIDELDTKFGIITDFKSGHTIKKQINENYVAQLMIYRFMCKYGKWLDDDSEINVDVKIVANHYLTWNTKEGSQFQKRTYPIWEDEYTEALIKKRLRPIVEFNVNGVLPDCNPYTPAKYWKCDCEKWEEQLRENEEEFGMMGEGLNG